MPHKADTVAFKHIDKLSKKVLGLKYKWHVCHGGFAVAGFSEEANAKSDAEDRNNRSERLGLKGGYKVEPASEGEFAEKE